jgi:Icc-related predicted phosphoesterase
MKILALSDQVIDRIYTLAVSGHFDDIDLVIGCGDLPYPYLEYLVTVLRAPLFYVPGNHDPVVRENVPAAHVGGATNLDMDVVFKKGLILAGLGGSIRYRPDGVNMYSQEEMYRRMLGLMPRLLFNRVRHKRMLDILVTHSPPFGINDDDTHAHTGLKALNTLIRWTQPRYHLHGHNHFVRHNIEPCEARLGATKILNIFPYKVIEF